MTLNQPIIKRSLELIMKRGESNIDGNKIGSYRQV